MAPLVASRQTDINPSPAASALACHRCMYDLTGHRETGPTGICPECGLGFEWNSLRTIPTSPPWCFELHIGKDAPILTLVKAAPASLFIALASPRRLWSGIELRHPFTRWSLARASVAMLCAGAASFVAVSSMMAMATFGLVALRNHAEQAATGKLWHRPAEFATFVREVWPMVVIPGTPWTVTSGDASRAVMLAAYAACVALLMPLGYLLLGTTMRRAKVRRAHLLRAATYGIALVPIPFVFVSAMTWSSLTFDLLAGWLTHTPFGRHPGFGVQIVNGLYSAARFSESLGPIASFVVSLGMIWSFWRRASGRYMKLPAAGLDAAILQILVMLLVPVFTIGVLSLLRHI